MVVVAFAYMAIVIAGAVYPLVSPLREFMYLPPTALEQAVDAVVATAWLAVLLASMARQPSGRLWKLIFLYLVAAEIGALEFVPDSLAWSVAQVVSQVRDRPVHPPVARIPFRLSPRSISIVWSWSPPTR